MYNVVHRGSQIIITGNSFTTAAPVNTRWSHPASLQLCVHCNITKYPSKHKCFFQGLNFVNVRGAVNHTPEVVEVC